jgi:hypothetical protein
MKPFNRSLVLFAALALTFGLSACGSHDDSTPAPAQEQPAPQPVVQNSPITSKWVNVDASSRIPALDLSQIALGSPQAITPVYDCVALLNGQPNESGTDPVNGVGLDQLQITDNGDGTGTIQFGPLSHADHNLDDVCYTLGQEPFNYTITGSSMTIVDPNYPDFPSTFNVAQ